MTTFTYDGLGRLTLKAYSDGSPSVTYGYDLADRTTSAANSADTLAWSYDLAGQMLTESSQANASLIEYDYNETGNRIQVQLNGAVVVDYDYDDADRLTSIQRGSSVYSFGYDGASRRTALSFPNGVQTTYAYDVKSRLTGISAAAGQTAVSATTYTYDDVDNRLTKGGDLAEGYGYDALNRLIQVTRGATTTEAYTYDKVGNRLTSLTEPSLSYGDRNQLLSMGAVQNTYDANGNLVSSSGLDGIRTFEWDAENRLKRVLLAGTELVRFTYDALGRRAEKTNAEETVKYAYDGEDILVVSANSNEWGAYSYQYDHGPGVDEPLATVYPNGFAAYRHADGLGGIVATTTPDVTVYPRQCDAFGNPEVGAHSGDAFTGREWDAETGLYYYRARYYDPKTGRFLSEDPIGFDGGDVNFYAYVRNQPVNLRDPSGMRYIPNIVINCDSRTYVATGDTGPNSPGQIFLIWPGLTPSRAVPGVTPPWWDVDFICTPCGWRKVPAGGVIIEGFVAGSIAPPPEWKPPFECPKENSCKIGGR